MILKAADWRFRVDMGATRERTRRSAADHCACAYCQNYYDTVELAHPRLAAFLREFGIDIAGPTELLPFAPTVVLVCYRVEGEILQWGKTELAVDDVPITAEAGEDGSFLLWAGELELPWVQQEREEDVISPANLPESLERMRQVWHLRHGEEFLIS